MKDSDKPKRKDNGQLLPGETANPDGNNGHIPGWQRYPTRLQRFCKMTGVEIKEYFDNDGAKLMSQTVMDIAAIQHAKDMIIGDADARHRAREAAVDRMEGKAPHVVKHGGDPDNNTPINMDGVFTLTFGTEENDGGSSPAA